MGHGSTESEILRLKRHSFIDGLITLFDCSQRLITILLCRVSKSFSSLTSSSFVGTLLFPIHSLMSFVHCLRFSLTSFALQRRSPAFQHSQSVSGPYRLANCNRDVVLLVKFSLCVCFRLFVANKGVNINTASK